MPLRLKKLIGSILLVSLVIVYSIIATIYAEARLGGASVLVHFIYYLVTGLLWVLPAMLLVKWMSTPPRRRS